MRVDKGRLRPIVKINEERLSFGLLGRKFIALGAFIMVASL